MALWAEVVVVKSKAGRCENQMAQAREIATFL